ncbi:MAG TPA: ABC transporter permease subunit [bacterium]|nr:ABC transporter permease subunit [bacterium]
MNPILLIARKESRELLGSGRGLAWLLALSAVLSVLGLLFVSNTELSLLDNAQVVTMELGTITALGALLAVVLGSDAIAGERERATLIPLLLSPARRTDIVLGKMGNQLVGWLVMYLIGLPYLWAVGSSGQNLAQACAYLALFGTPLVLGFGFLAQGLSSRAAAVRSALVPSLLALILLGGPVMLGPSFRQSAIGSWLDRVNPFAAAINSFDSVVIDSQSLSAQLARLAIVLIWLAATAAFARSSATSMNV